MQPSCFCAHLDTCLWAWHRYSCATAHTFPLLALTPSDLRFKNVRDIPENLPRFSENLPRFSEKLPRFLVKLPRFLVKLQCFRNTLQPLCPHLPLFSPSTSPITAPCFLLPHASVGTFHFPPRSLLSPSSLTSLHNHHFCQGFLTRIRAYIGIYIFSLSQPSQTPLITYYKSAISANISDNF